MVPNMPRLGRKDFSPKRRQHRNIIRTNGDVPFNVCVARPVVGKEKQSNEKAQAALQKEWSRLREIPTWDEDDVHEWSDIQKRPGDNHVGKVFDICVEKMPSWTFQIQLENTKDE